MFQPGNSGLPQLNAHQNPCVLCFRSFLRLYIPNYIYNSSHTACNILCATYYVFASLLCLLVTLLTWGWPEFPGWNAVVFSNIGWKKKKIVWSIHRQRECLSKIIFCTVCALNQTFLHSQVGIVRNHSKHDKNKTTDLKMKSQMNEMWGFEH